MKFLTNIDKNNNLIVYSSTNNSKYLSDDFKKRKYNIIVSRYEARQIAAFLKLHSLTRVTSALDISVVDHINSEMRFNINYHLRSFTTNSLYSLITWANEYSPILSLQNLFPAFNWAEREVWDMYGIFIIKHPDLRRILTDYGFEGYPLRKDFPLSGFKEIQYEDSIKQIEYTNTELTQSYRLLLYSNTWNNN